MQDIIFRENIIQSLSPFISKNIIKIITGQRRVGKSYILKQIAKTSNSKNSIFIDKELYKFDFIKDYHNLIKYVEEHENNNIDNNPILLFIDEIQDIFHYEKALRHFHNENKYDIYITGSNAKLLSGELATYLSGRYIQFEVHSLSFNEFNIFHQNNNFSDYMKYGGMPYLKYLSLTPEITYEYLFAIYQSIILKDVVERYSLRNVNFLEKLVLYLCDNIGSITSPFNIVKFLKNQRININIATVMNYLKALQNCYFIYEVPRYDIQGKNIFEINHKYYLEDIGIRNAIIGYNQIRDNGKLLENIIFMHLKRKNYQIYVGIIKDKEVDFIAEKNNERIYVQVALNINSNSTMEREFASLQLIKDNYPKYVVTMDDSSPNSIDGIKHLSVQDFLKEI